MLNPDRTRYEGVNHYRLYLGGYMAIVKVTNKKSPQFLEGFYIAPRADVLVIVRKFRTSKEFKVVLNLATKARLQGVSLGHPYGP